MLKRTIGVFLTAVAAAVAVHTVLEPLYHVSGDGQPYSPVWNILDPLMAVAIVLGLVLGYRRKQEAEAQGGEAGVTREYLVANIQLYGLLCVGILFLLELVQPAHARLHRAGRRYGLPGVDSDRCHPSAPVGRHGDPSPGREGSRRGDRREATSRRGHSGAGRSRALPRGIHVIQQER